MAALLAEIGRFEDAALVYEDVSDRSLHQFIALLTFYLIKAASKELNEACHNGNAIGLLFNALLCHLCTGGDAAAQALQRQ